MGTRRSWPRVPTPFYGLRPEDTATEVKKRRHLAAFDSIAATAYALMGEGNERRLERTTEGGYVSAAELASRQQATERRGARIADFTSTQNAVAGSGRFKPPDTLPGVSPYGRIGIDSPLVQTIDKELKGIGRIEHVQGAVLHAKLLATLPQLPSGKWTIADKNETPSEAGGPSARVPSRPGQRAADRGEHSRAEA
jgi:hypothetical protein